MVKSSKGSRLSHVAAGALAAAIGAHGAAFAQTSESEEVVVTALKRETTLIETPAAITAISGDELAARQITSIESLAAAAPNLVVGQASGVSWVSVRGIGIGSTSGGIEGSVALHLDGAYLAQAASLDALMFDVSSVEVLRGPQGTLYGRNATGGTVNFISNRPTQETDIRVAALTGAFERTRLEGVVSGGVSENVALRAAVMWERQDEGYGENVYLRQTFGNREAHGGRLSGRFDLTDTLRVDASVFRFWDWTDGIQLTRLNPFNATARANNPIFNTAAPRPSDPRDINAESQADAERVLEGGNITVNWDFTPNLALRSITSYTRVDYSNLGADGDGTELPMVHSDRIEDTAAWQQEFNLIFRAFDSRLEGLVGVYYNDERLSLEGHNRWLAANPQGFVNVAGQVVPAGTDVVGFLQQDTTSSAVFADVTFALTDNWSIYAGARQSRDERAIVQTTGLAGLPGNVGLAACNARRFANDWDSTTGKIGVAFTGSLGNLYLQWAEGFKAGGFNAYNCGDAYEPEEVISVEAGYKVQAFGDRLRFAASVFHYDYTNLQVSQIVNLQQRIENAAAATITGAEFETFLRASDLFSVDLNIALLDATYDRYTDLDPLRPALGFQSLAGNRLNRAPEYTVNLGLTFSAPISDGRLTLRGEVFHSDDVYFRQFNQPQDKQDAYTTYNLFATWDTGGPVSIRAFGRNITDEDILLGVFSAGTIFDRWAIYAPPRTWGVELRAEF
ncbi:MAG: TonB-dependent receptor [Hyphomonadaceae bacterium]|nr:TonB-dependent receptor [Hyphomonadaceae bacterium]